MTMWPGSLHLPVPGEPGAITMSRPMAPQENADRWRAIRVAWLLPILLITAGGGGVVLCLLRGATSHWDPNAMLWAAVTWVGLLAFACAIGLPLGIAVGRSRTARELGPSGVLTTVWNPQGFTVATWILSRSFPYADVRSVRIIRSAAVFRLRVHQMNDPMVVAIPLGFIPPIAWEALRQAGARGVPGVPGKPAAPGSAAK